MKTERSAARARRRRGRSSAKAAILSIRTVRTAGGAMRNIVRVFDIRRARFTAVVVMVMLVVTGCSAPQTAATKTVVLGEGPTGGTAAPAMPGKNVPAIKVNTVGYPTSWPKIVVFNVPPVGAVVKDAAGKVVLAIEPSRVSERGVDAASQDPVWQVDVSDLE